jgi:hypothetical protein
MTFVHWLIALLGLSVLAGGVIMVAIDWLLYTYLFRRFSEKVRNGLSIVFAFVTGLVICLLTAAHMLHYALS